MFVTRILVCFPVKIKRKENIQKKRIEKFNPKNCKEEKLIIIQCYKGRPRRSLVRGDGKIR